MVGAMQEPAQNESFRTNWVSERLRQSEAVHVEHGDDRDSPAAGAWVTETGSRLFSAFSNSSTLRIRPPTYVPVGCQDSLAIVVVEKIHSCSRISLTQGRPSCSNFFTNLSSTRFSTFKERIFSLRKKRYRESVCYERSHHVADGSDASPTMRVDPSKSAYRRRLQTTASGED